MVVIRVENVYKQYRLGQFSTGALAHDVNKAWYLLRGKENPYQLIGEENDRTKSGINNYVLALQNANFTISKGEVVGIIGRNGAGKSTLLKILSRTTTPTMGTIKVKGNMASLLEVGTGFHPELSGKENIYLNGAILGMTRREIKNKLEEIIDFAGIERYIDTPVKRYSSGMYVRLAFAVAAHLEPDILIVDEVLAVGDSEFQKKALGKMKDVSNAEGRTVLVVSHSMAAIENICTRVLHFDKGRQVNDGLPYDVISGYLRQHRNASNELLEIKEREGNGQLKFSKAFVRNIKDNTDIMEAFGRVEIGVEYLMENSIDFSDLRIDIGINNALGTRVAWLSTEMLSEKPDFNEGKVIFEIYDFPFSPGNYTCTLYAEVGKQQADWLPHAIEFSVAERDYYNIGKSIPHNQGNILLKYTAR